MSGDFEQLSLSLERPEVKIRRDARDTSVRAGLEHFARSGTARRRVYDHIVLCGDDGATDEEIQLALGMNPSTERPRRVELKERGFIRDSGKRRKTTYNCDAAVWVLAERENPDE